MIQLKQVHHIAMLTESALYGACKLFYTEVLGFTIVAETYRKERDSYKLDLALNGVYQLELFSFPEYRERASYPEAKGLRHLAFAVDDMDAGLAWLQQHAVRVEEIRTDELTGKRFLFFYDPNGQPLELYQY